MTDNAPELPEFPKKRHRYDWRLQPRPANAADETKTQLEERWTEGISTYGPYFKGDPLDNADEETFDLEHYLRAARRERDAMRLALQDIAAIAGSGRPNPDALTQITRIAGLLISQVKETGG